MIDATHASGTAARRLGRPPATEAGATRERIVDAAREAFAELGFTATTNKLLADGAGVTTGAIYHYFESKLELYGAVWEEAQSTVYERFDAIVAGAETFVDGMAVVLEAAHELNNTDPSLARFLGAARVDIRRSPELAAVIPQPAGRRNDFVRGLVEVGVRSGELAAGDADRVVAMLLTLLIGLVDAVSDSPVTHRAAVDAMKQLIAGDLVHAVGAPAMAVTRGSSRRQP